MRKAFDLRPLEFGDILSRSFALYVAHFSLFAGLFLLFVFVPSALLQLGEYFFLPVPKPSSSSRTIEDPAKAFASIFVFLLEIVLALAFAGSGVYYLVSRVYLGAKTTIREAFSAVGSHFGQLLGSGLIVLVAVGVLVAICVVPAVIGLSDQNRSNGAGTFAIAMLLGMGIAPLLLWLTGRYGLVFCAVMLEDMGPEEALPRSAELTRGYTWRLIGLCTVMALCLCLLQTPAWILEGFLSGKSREWRLVGDLVGAAWTALILPVMVIPSVIYYFDLRCRKEGFDLAVLAATFGVDPNFIARLQATGRYSYDIPAYMPKGWDPKKQPSIVMPQMPQPQYAPYPPPGYPGMAGYPPPGYPPQGYPPPGYPPQGYPGQPMRGPGRPW